jgi:transposase
VATITGDDVPPIQENFGTTKSELERFRSWLVANKCEQVAFEATGVNWIPVYDACLVLYKPSVTAPLQVVRRS